MRQAPAELLEREGGVPGSASGQRRPGCLSGAIDPSPVFDRQLPLDEVAEAYLGTDERRSTTTMLRP